MRHFPLRPAPFLAALSVAMVAALPAAGHAQQTRVQVAGSNMFWGDAHVLYGADAGQVLGDQCVIGGPPCEVPSFDVLFGAYGGVSPTQSIPFSLYAHIGLEYMVTADVGVALLGYGFAQPLQGGPALRVDAMDIVAIKAGYGWGVEEDGVFLGLEVAGETLVDLFFR